MVDVTSFTGPSRRGAVCVSSWIVPLAYLCSPFEHSHYTASSYIRVTGFLR